MVELLQNSNDYANLRYIIDLNLILRIYMLYVVLFTVV